MTYPDPTTNQPPTNHQPTTNQPPTNQGLAAQALGCHEVPQGSTRQLPHRAALVRLEVTGTQQGDAVEEIVHLWSWNWWIDWWLNGG